MRKNHIALLALGAGLAFIVLSGTRNNQAISTVQNKIMPFEGAPTPVKDWLTDVAGVRGSVQWQAFSPEGYDANITVVQAGITKPQGDAPKTAEIQWLVNTDTGQFRARHVTINGAAEPVFVGLAKLQMWSLELLGDN